MYSNADQPSDAMTDTNTTELDIADQKSRQFIRHAATVPVICNREGHLDDAPLELANISHGGLAFVSAARHLPGDVLEISFPSMRNHPAIHGEVVWSRAASDGEPAGYIEGIRFLNEADHFRARLVEQICYIEAYVAEQTKAGRSLTREQAAEEWTAKYAAAFPQ